MVGREVTLEQRKRDKDRFTQKHKPEGKRLAKKRC